MDAGLFVLSTSLSAYLPRCVFPTQTTTEQSSMAVAIGLSLGLFSLTILEAAPSSSMLILSPDPKVEGELPVGLITISRVYWALLWALSLVILVVLPCLAGVTFAEKFEHLFPARTAVDRDDRKYPLFVQPWRICPWWVRFVGGLLKIVMKNACGLLQKFCLPQNIIRSTPEPILVMTVNDEEIRQAASADLEMRNLVSTPKHGGGVNGTSANNTRFLTTFGSICGVSTIIVIVSSLGPIIVKTPSDKSALSVIVSWLCAVGLLISSLLNGFGSVSMPYSCLAGLYLKPVRPEVVTKLEGELKNVREAMVKKRAALREMTVAVRQSRSTTASSPGMRMSKIGSFAELGEELNSRKQILQTEIDFLEDLCKDIAEDISELKYSQALAAKARTTVGRVRVYIGLVFSLILLIRLLSAARNIWRSYSIDTDRHKVPHGDIVTTAMVFLTGHDLLSQEDYNRLSQLVSLVLTMLLSASQIRTFLRTVAAVSRRINQIYQKCYCTNACGVGKQFDFAEEMSSPGLYSQLVAGATGCYFLSCIVLIKMMLPMEFCEGFSKALGGTDVFTIHTSIVDTVYTCSAGVSVAILGMLFGIQRQNNLRHTAPTKLPIVIPDV